MIQRLPQQLSTDLVPEAQRLAFWTDMVCSTYVQLDCDAPPGVKTVSGTIGAATLATLQLSQVESTAQVVRRTPARIACASEDFFLVSIQTRGTGRIEQDGRSACLTPGDFALYDSTRPYALHFDAPFQQFVLRLPGQTLRSALRDSHALTASTVSGQRGAGHLMIGMIRGLADNIHSLAPESASAVAESVTQILVAGLASLPAAQRTPVSQRLAYHRQQIKACVRARLREPGLTVGAIAAELRVAVSSLHRAWQGEGGTIAEYIWAQRLEAARRDLCSPAHQARSVSAIAYSWGFNDAAHFSRAFRARFGCAPRDMRDAG